MTGDDVMDKTVLTAFLEYSQNPTWLVDPDGRCVHANQALKKISAISANQEGDLNWLELVADRDREIPPTLWQDSRVHHQPYRARFFLRGKDSASGSAVDVVGTEHIAPDGSEVWLFTALPSPPSGKALSPIEANLQVTLNALPIQAWYARASGALAFLNEATANYLGLPSDHPLRFAGDLEAPWDVNLAFLHPEDRTESRRNWTEYIQAGSAPEHHFPLIGSKWRIPLVSFPGRAHSRSGGPCPVVGWRKCRYR